MLMGAWGAGPFDNDDAMDWTYTLEAATDDEPIRQALAARSMDSPEATVASVAIAAADVVAAGLGRSGGSVPQPVLDWIAGHPSIAWQAHVAPALAVLAQIGTDSELAELWAEADDSEWREGLDDLRSHLIA
jgi:hypothetical protein